LVQALAAILLCDPRQRARHAAVRRAPNIAGDGLLELGLDGSVRLPALSTAHSHAFQRKMRGRAQRPPSEGASLDDFWSWRAQMYSLASSLTPESIRAVSSVAFTELARAGVRTVGEFHYVHHQADGTPYDDRTVLADCVIEAAKSAGLRIALLRVAYHRAQAGVPAEVAQRRFCDPRVDDVLRDIDLLRSKWLRDPDVVIGVAPHSVRAVPPSWLGPLREYADRHLMPLHMHVAEQRREVDECLAESGRRPVELLAEHGLLSHRFVAVHATHLAGHEAQLLGAARAFVCLCPQTERDLGDGLPDVGAMRAAGVRLCTGVDSHVVTDPIEDLRSVETHERLRTERRITFRPTHPSTPAEQLWREGSIQGAQACGFDDAGGQIVIRRDDPSLDLVEDEFLLDAIVFGTKAGAALVDHLER